MYWLKYLPIILSGVSWVLLYGVGYYSGSSATNQKWVLKTQKETIFYQNKLSNLIAQVRRQEQEYRDKIDAIVSDNIKKEEELRNEYEQTISDLNNGKLTIGGLHECKSDKTSNNLPAAKQNSAELVCYSKAELQSKIQRSLAITVECDQLAVRYNSLLKVCQTNVEQTKVQNERDE